MNMLPGNYIAGFVDGEGCFYLNYRREIKRTRKGQPQYYRWTPYFAISMRKDDRNILELIKDTLKCGKIFNLKSNYVWYGVQNVNDIHNKIVPFFRRYSLRAKKRMDFDLWAQAVEIIYNRKNDISGKVIYREIELQKLIKIRQNMKNYKGRLNEVYKYTPRGEPIISS